MKTENVARIFLVLASLLGGAAAVAQSAAKPASEEVDVRGEFRVNTAKDDGFIAPESASGTRTGACGSSSGYAARGRPGRTTPVHFTAFTRPARAAAAVEIIAGNRRRVQAPSGKRPLAVVQAWRAHPTDWLLHAAGRPTAPFSRPLP